MSTLRKLTTIGFATLLFAVVAAPAAEAAEHWGAVGSFGLAPGDPQPLSNPAGVAVNQSTGHTASGDVYVVDQGNDRVEWFDSAGKYEGQFNGSATPAKAFSEPEGIAVDSDPTSPSFGDVYVIDEGHSVVDKFSSNGTYLGQLTGTCETAGESPPLCPKSKFVPFVTLDGVAVDPHGVVWVENGHEHFVHPAIADFTSEQPNEFIASRISQVETSSQRGLAIDAEDNLYVVHLALDVAKLNSAGEVLGGEPGETLAAGASGVTVNPANNDLYADVGANVAVVSPTESPVESFGGGVLNKAGSIAVDPNVGASGYAYIVEPADNDVLILEHSETLQGPPAAPETKAATGVTSSAAQLNGKLNEGGVGYSFSYIAERAEPGASCTETGSISTPLDNGATNPTVSSEVSANVTGLEPDVKYVFCLVADGFGAMVGSQESFTTSAAAPTVISESAKNTHEEDTIFSATINPNHSEQETTYLFEYSTEGSPETNTLSGTIQTVEGASSIAPNEYGEQTVTSQTAELFPVETTFYYRIAATNGAGTTHGEVKAYTKSPVVANTRASGLTLSSAILQAEIYPNFQQTKYSFEYAPGQLALEEGNGEKVPGATELEGNGRLELASCADGTTAFPVGGGSFGCDDGSTPKCPNKAIPTPFENSLACFDPVTAAISGLEEHTPYDFRAVAENASSENPTSPNKGKPVFGEIAVFTTERLPFAETEHAENVGRASATLSGIVIPFDQRTTYYFQYITQARYEKTLASGSDDPYTGGEATPTLPFEASNERHHVGPIAAVGLLPETTYHYRLVAENEWGASYGEDQTFTTTGKVLPEATTGPPTGITQTTATITATVTTNGLKTSYGFEIATTPGDFGPPTGLGSISGAASQTVTETLSELQPATTYYYQITATNVDGTTHGTEQAFTTTPPPNLLTTPPTPPTLTPIPTFELPKEEPTPPKTNPPTKKQLLIKALKTCKKDKNKTKRTHCEKKARAKYKTTPKQKQHKT